jgi:hypothetical protein
MVLHKSGTVHGNTSWKWFAWLMDVFRMADPMERKLVLLGFAKWDEDIPASSSWRI